MGRFATLSDGTDYDPLNAFKRHEKALAKAQRAMARKQRFSNNWKKAKTRVRALHARIGNARRDYLHQLSHTISKNHVMVCIEDLRVRNMSASATGTVDAPGKRVRAKSGLNKAILDQGWGEFRRQLEYKLTWRGGELLAVPPQNTSRTCPRCGHIAKENRRSQARFCCVQCDYENHADVVGAINVLRAGRMSKQHQLPTHKLSRQRADNPNEPGIRLATMHRVKGLEFRCVMLVSINHHVVPLRQALSQSVDPVELRSIYLCRVMKRRVSF